MIYDRFNEKIAIKSRDSVSQPTWGGPGYVGKTGTHSITFDVVLFYTTTVSGKKAKFWVAFTCTGIMVNRYSPLE